MEKVNKIVLSEYKNNNLVSLFKGDNKKPIKNDKYSPSFDKIDFDTIVNNLNVIAETDTNVQIAVDNVISEMLGSNYVYFYYAYEILWSIAFDQDKKPLKISNRIKEQLKEKYQIFTNELNANYINKDVSYANFINHLEELLRSKNKETLL